MTNDRRIELALDFTKAYFTSRPEKMTLEDFKRVFYDTFLELKTLGTLYDSDEMYGYMDLLEQSSEKTE